MYLLQRHRMPIRCRFEWSLGLAYALPASVLQPLLPPGLVLDTYSNFGFLAIVLVHTRELRPAFVPGGVGMSFFLAGYRVFTRYTTQSGETLRGLKVLRTDTNHRAMCLLGNALTHYNYNLATWDVQRTASSHAVRIATPDRTADLHVEVDLGSDATLPPSSPFPDLREAREFAAPLLYTFEYEQQTNSIIRVEGIRDDRWKPGPVDVKVHHSSFLEQGAFRDSGAKLANAFWIEDVPYGWRRGIREELE